MTEPNGELVPIGGGDSIPLNRVELTVGRRESCDVCLRFPSISGIHCELRYRDGYWAVRDMGSTNGIKVNGEKLTKCAQRPLRPGDELAIASRRYTIQYNLATGGQEALEALLDEEQNVFGNSLLEKAGLAKPSRSLRDDD